MSQNSRVTTMENKSEDLAKDMKELRVKVEDVRSKVSPLIPKDQWQWFNDQMNDIKALINCLESDSDVIAKRSGKMRVAIEYGRGYPRLLVNGEEIDIPEYEDEDDDFKPRVPVERIFNSFAKDELPGLICGTKMLTDNDIKKLSEYLSPHWAEIDGILGIE